MHRLLLAVALLASPAAAQFRFQNNFWVNLHHFVRAEVRRRDYGEKPLLALPESVLQAYAGLAKASLFQDDRLIRINDALALIGVDTLPAAEFVDPAVAAALNTAAPLYRAELWDRHRRANDKWIAAREPLVRRHGAALAKAL